MSKTPLSEYSVSVLAAEGDSSAGGKGLAWTLCYLPRDEQSRGGIAVDAARTWWSETDQSTDCEVTLRFEGRHYGVDVSFTRKVRLTIQTIGQVVPLSAEDADGYRHTIQAEREAREAERRAGVKS